MNILEKKNCSDIIDNPIDENVLNMKSVLKRWRDQKDLISRYKARHVVSENEGNDFQDDSFSPVSDFTVAKLTLCMSIQKGWVPRHFDFGNAFPNDHLEKMDKIIQIYFRGRGMKY